MLNNIIKYTLYTFTLLFPLFFLPITPESYEINKMMLLIVTTLILLLLLSLKAIKERKLIFFRSAFTIPFFFLALLTLISTLFQSPNPILALTTPLSASTIIAGFVFYLLLIPVFKQMGDTKTNQENGGDASGGPPISAHLRVKTSEEHLLGVTRGRTRIFQDPQIIIMNLLTIPAVILSFYTIAMYLDIVSVSRFTPAGSLLASFEFLLVIDAFLITKVILYLWRNSKFEYRNSKRFENLDFENSNLFRASDLGFRIYDLLSLIPITISIIILFFHLATDQKPVMLPFIYGWQVFVEILKNFRSFLLGVGPTGFVSIYTLARPVEINATAYWNVIFTSSSSFLLTLATEVGVLAAALYLWILIKAIRINSKFEYRNSKQYLNSNDQNSKRFENLDFENLNLFRISDFGFRISLISTLLLQFLLPGNMTVFILSIFLLALSADKRKVMHINLSRFKIFNYLLLLPVAAVILIAGYFVGRFYLAEVLFKSSLDAIVNKSGTEAYNNQRDAIALNPYLDRYHLAFSQTNMALANAIAGGNQLTDTDKQNIPRLIQQSTDYARSATTLNRTNAVNWENLGGIYESIINFAEGADSWAIQSYRQKIILDPLNPQSHFKMGKLLYTLKKTSDSELYLRQAIGLKQDYAAAHYLLGIILTGDKKYEDAYRELQTTLAYLASGSDDAKRVEKELSDLAKLLPNPPNSDPGSLLLDETGKQPKSAELQTLENIESSPAAFPTLNQPIPTISLY